MGEGKWDGVGVWLVESCEDEDTGVWVMGLRVRSWCWGRVWVCVRTGVREGWEKGAGLAWGVSGGACVGI